MSHPMNEPHSFSWMPTALPSPPRPGRSANPRLSDRAPDAANRRAGITRADAPRSVNYAHAAVCATVRTRPDSRQLARESDSTRLDSSLARRTRLVQKGGESPSLTPISHVAPRMRGWESPQTDALSVTPTNGDPRCDGLGHAARGGEAPGADDSSCGPGGCGCPCLATFYPSRGGGSVKINQRDHSPSAPASRHRSPEQFSQGSPKALPEAFIRSPPDGRPSASKKAVASELRSATAAAASRRRRPRQRTSPAGIKTSPSTPASSVATDAGASRDAAPRVDGGL
jgi:hypothetical protein